MADEPVNHTQRWTKHFEEIDFEIGQLAKVCQVPLLDPGVIERVLHHDMLVCGHQNQRAFDKLHQLLMVHCSVRDKALVALGRQDGHHRRHCRAAAPSFRRRPGHAAAGLRPRV